MSSSLSTNFARASSRETGSPLFSRTMGVRSSQEVPGTKVTETLVGSNGFCKESETEPAAASSRPQLSSFSFKKPSMITAYLASSPYNAVLTSIDVDIVDATL